MALQSAICDVAEQVGEVSKKLNVIGDKVDTLTATTAERIRSHEERISLLESHDDRNAKMAENIQRLMDGVDFVTNSGRAIGRGAKKLVPWVSAVVAFLGTLWLLIGRQ